MAATTKKILEWSHKEIKQQGTALSGKLLHGGKGKNKMLVNVNYTSNPTMELSVQPCTAGGWEVLRPPRQEEMKGGRG